MIYKTHKDVYKTISEKLNIDYNIIKSVGDFYWEDISDRISEFKNREIYINRLGVFRFRKLESTKYISYIDKIESFMRRLNRSEESIQKAIEDANEKKRKMEVLIEEWIEIVNESRKYKEARNANRNIQKQNLNMGGSKEQII